MQQWLQDECGLAHSKVGQSLPPVYIIKQDLDQIIIILLQYKTFCYCSKSWLLSEAVYGKMYLVLFPFVLNDDYIFY